MSQAHILLAVVGGTATTFLIYFEIAMLRELRRTPKLWKLRLRVGTETPCECRPIRIAFLPAAGKLARLQKEGRISR